MHPAHSLRRRLAAAVLTGVGTLAAPEAASAAFTPTTTINLTTAGSSGSSQGALFYQADPHPTGTGFIDPFVRIQMRGFERGYNTDARPVEFETKDENQWTHSLLLSSLDPVAIGAMQYYKFSLDINEQGNATGSKLSMNDFRIYLGDSPSLTGWNDGFGANSVKVYDIDAEKRGSKTIDATVELNYRLGHGSGSGDMNVFVPVSLFVGHGSQFKYVYLYSSFGNPNQSDAGFEEWWAQTRTKFTPPPPTTPPGAVPAPPAAVLGLIGVGGLFFSRNLRRKPAPATA